MDGLPVLVLGAGVTGLVAARALADDGVHAIVVDRGRAAGGRLGTARVGDALADTGAQFFTVRSDEFGALVERWREEGCPIREWSRGFAQAGTVRDHPALAAEGGDGHPRYVVDGGMERLASHLASGLDVRLDTEVESVTATAGGWHLTGGGAAAHGMEGQTLLCTAPAPETLALLEAGHVALPPDAADLLYGMTFAPCISVIAMLDRPPALPQPGGIQFEAGTVTWIADNAAKGISSVPALTIHAAGDWSAAHWADPDEHLCEALLETAHGWLDGAGAVVTTVWRWRYAQAHESHRDRVVEVSTTPPLLVAGDALAGSKVEGAALSGLAAARRVHDA